MGEAKEVPRTALEKIINKAAWLLEDGRVVKISDVLYYVMGRKNRHMVRVEGGKLYCTCPGFKEKGICSHVVAVSAVMEMKDGTKFLDERIKIRLQRELRELVKGVRR